MFKITHQSIFLIFQLCFHPSQDKRSKNFRKILSLSIVFYKYTGKIVKLFEIALFLNFSAIVPCSSCNRSFFWPKHSDRLDSFANMIWIPEEQTYKIQYIWWFLAAEVAAEQGILLYHYNLETFHIIFLCLRIYDGNLSHHYLPILFEPIFTLEQKCSQKFIELKHNM